MLRLKRWPTLLFTLVIVVAPQIGGWFNFATTTTGEYDKDSGFLIATFLLFAVVAGTLIFAIIMSRKLPLADAVILAIGSLALLIGTFATTYVGYGTRANWGVRLSHVDGLLVALGTFTTAGTSGITAHTEFARALLDAQLAAGIPAAILVFGILVGRLARLS